MLKYLATKLKVAYGSHCPCHGEPVYQHGHGSRPWCAVTRQRVDRDAVYHPVNFVLPTTKFALGAIAILVLTIPFFTHASTSMHCVDTFKNPITYGMRNLDVIKLQNFLIADGEDIPAGATGYYGDQTKAAVSDFQIKFAAQILFPAGLYAPTGNVYKYTMSQINAMICLPQ